MSDYALYIESRVPPIFEELYETLLKALEQDTSRYEGYSLAFRCRKCEDVIEIRIENIRVIYFYQDFIRLEFDKHSTWLSPYSAIEDIWIEKFTTVEDKQMKFEDFE